MCCKTNDEQLWVQSFIAMSSWCYCSQSYSLGGAVGLGFALLGEEDGSTSNRSRRAYTHSQPENS